jgi:putative CocE/NonD family hydrolase
VSDVYPDGRSILIIDGIRRARFRDSWERETFMKPGQVYKVAFDVGWLSQIFNKGHRIRVTVASTGAPFYDPNPQTGGEVTYEPPAKVQVATQTLHHKSNHASRIIAPVYSGRK